MTNSSVAAENSTFLRERGTPVHVCRVFFKELGNQHDPKSLLKHDATLGRDVTVGVLLRKNGNQGRCWNFVGNRGHC
jgi:hypothetical protein